MNAQYKPISYSTVSPYLIVNGADATIDFLEASLWRHRATQIP